MCNKQYKYIRIKRKNRAKLAIFLIFAIDKEINTAIGLKAFDPKEVCEWEDVKSVASDWNLIHLMYRDVQYAVGKPVIKSTILQDQKLDLSRPVITQI